MIEIKIDEDELRSIYLVEVQRRLDKIESESLLMTGAELKKYLNLSWPTISELFLWRDDFKRIKVGSKYLFFKPDVDVFIEKWVREIEVAGGDAKSLNRVRKAKQQREIV
ncbi:hypothetical protein [Domibacillus mangrovi]|uniref:Uncharacterized protein n=1 Tax=Domibacillus mangrovi TaxID=1714354 RepID=A0A1Q5P680_9BACI|nr:hypothetical protein [Domibacillus mangrovi]OKL37602.1 hypothetical protein BLL40_04670 [Domibacillus mangrovi]